MSFEDHGMRMLVHVLIKQLFQWPHRRSGLHSRTFKERAYLPDSERPQAGELAKGQLHEEDGDPADGQHDEVRNQESSCKKQGKKPLKHSTSPAQPRGDVAPPKGAQVPPPLV